MKKKIFCSIISIFCNQYENYFPLNYKKIGGKIWKILY